MPPIVLKLARNEFDIEKIIARCNRCVKLKTRDRVYIDKILESLIHYVHTIILCSGSATYLTHANVILSHSEITVEHWFFDITGGTRFVIIIYIYIYRERERKILFKIKWHAPDAANGPKGKKRS